MHVESENLDTTLERLLDHSLRLRRWQPELRAVMPGDDGLVCVRVDPQGHTYEHIANARGGGERHLVRRVEDDGRALGGGQLQERVVLVVAVDDQLGTGQA